MPAHSIVPPFGLGTYRLKERVAFDSVMTALELGYRAVDTAQIYENEEHVGEALAASGVARDSLFVTTKIWTDNLAPEKLIPSLQESLSRLRSDYADLVLIHWPSPGGTVPLQASLDALLEARQRGLTRHIGVSNFTVALLQQAIDHAGADNIATNQVELHPWLQQPALTEYARAQGIHLTSYMTLGYGKVLEDPALQDIAAAHAVSAAQVALAWAMQQGHAVIPSSTQRAHLQANLDATKLKLSADDMQRIATLDRQQRLINPASLAPVWD